MEAVGVGEQGLAEALGRFGLGEHAPAIRGLGVASLGELLQASDGVVDGVQDLLEDAGAARRARRGFRDWLAEARAAQREAPPPGSASGHLYGLTARLNSKDATGVEAATVLRLDIDPFTRDRGGRPTSTLRVAPGAVERQVQAAADGPVPVVSLLGPTGAGKSFLTSLFMEAESAASSRPLVAQADQHVPTSAHVCLHRGAARPSAKERTPLLLLDFEGEDGRIPKNLEEGSLRRLASCLSLGFTEDALRAQLKATVAQRQHVVKEVLPSIAYLISDVVLFVDQVEPRRTERSERIRSFAEQAHRAVESLRWRPALLLVQNKWTRGPQEAARYDITSEYDWMVEDLGQVFSRVTVLRLPAGSDRHTFEGGVLALHGAVREAARAVQALRCCSASLYAEPDFWFGLEALVGQLSEQGVAEIARYQSLSEALSRRLASHDAVDNAAEAMRLLGPLPAEAEEFRGRVRQVLGWYAYNLAGQARFQGDAQRVRDGLPDVYGRLMERLSAEEPCRAVLRHGGWAYPCTQRRAGHGAQHRNPAVIAVDSAHLLKRVLLWRDRVPCVWPGGFEGCESVSLDAFLADFDRYAEKMPADQYEEAFADSAAAKVLLERRSREATGNMCLSCLCVSDDLARLPDPVCHHHLCRRCVFVRKRLSKAEDEIVCPLCKRRSTLPRQPEVGRLRVLALDGGGVRGLVEIRVLQRLEERFAPLPVASLFDLIVGTSAGGLVSLGVLARRPLGQLQSFVEALARDILDVNPLAAGWRRITGQPVCNTEAFVRALAGLFGEERLEDYRDRLPYCCCTTYCCPKYFASAEPTALAGNFPPDLSRHFAHCHADRFVSVGHATAAAPTFFGADLHKPSVRFYDNAGREQVRRVLCSRVDGGVEANCPARLAARAAEELQTRPGGAAQGASMEALVSLGTGRQPAKPSVPSDNALHWGLKLIDIATDAETQWEAFVKENPMSRGVPKLRVNPPDLGGEAAFSSKSVPRVLEGMERYFGSAEGRDAMDRLFHLTYAKLWEVEGLFALVAGSEPVELKLVLRDPRFEVQELKRPALCEIILARGSLSAAELESMEMAALADLAQKSLNRQPVSPPMPGSFAFIFDGEDRAIEEGSMAFKLARAEEGMPLLSVVWRTEQLGDFPISGFPRLVRVVPNEK
uniref:RING-type domain-containing protein n=1 Tax=Alexandrium monilatum TaxID=311494 RepID=A0A7S4W7R8_9DINO